MAFVAIDPDFFLSSGGGRAEEPTRFQDSVKGHSMTARKYAPAGRNVCRVHGSSWRQRIAEHPWQRVVLSWMYRFSGHQRGSLPNPTPACCLCLLSLLSPCFPGSRGWYSPRLRHRASPGSKGGTIVWLIPTRSVTLRCAFAWGNRQTMRVGLASPTANDLHAPFAPRQHYH